jgi:hypothetical protein
MCSLWYIYCKLYIGESFKELFLWVSGLLLFSKISLMVIVSDVFVHVRFWRNIFFIEFFSRVLSTKKF